MNRKSVALVFGIMLLILLASLGGSQFLQSINENNIVNRQIRTARAFWAAEAGIAHGISQLRDCEDNGNCTASDTITYGSDSYNYSATITDLGSSHYKISSTASLGDTTKKVYAAVELNDVDASNFSYGVETQGTVDVSGSAAITPSDSVNESATLVFENYFGFSKEQIKAMADYTYTDPENNIEPVAGITWVTVSEGGSFKITSNTWAGSGILIIEGDVILEGDTVLTGGDFDGIIYVIGDMDVPAGNPTIDGALLIEGSSTAVTRFRGNFELNYDTTEIDNALDNIRFRSPSLMAWWESD